MQAWQQSGALVENRPSIVTIRGGTYVHRSRVANQINPQRGRSLTIVKLKEGYKSVLLADVVEGKEQHFLGADIGGTNARFYMFATQRRNPMNSELLYTETYSTKGSTEKHWMTQSWKEYLVGQLQTLATINITKFIKEFMDAVRMQPGLQGIAADKLHWACFAVAGPVDESGEGQRADLTNADWQHIITTQIEQEMDIKGVTLINDFVAQGRGITLLKQKPADKMVMQDITEVGGNGLMPATDFVQVYTPKELKKEERISPLKPNTKKHPIVVLGPGTGMGEALAFCDPNGFLTVFPTEGGHCGFTPWDDVTRSLQVFFDHAYGFTEVETILCGKGLVRLYVFLKACFWDADAKVFDMSKQLPPDEVRRIADEQKDVLAVVDREEYDIMPYHVTLIIELLNGGDSTELLETYSDGQPLIEKHQRRREKIVKMIEDGVLVPEAMSAAFRLFLTALGVEAGGMALNTLAYGGVYLAGGIVKREGTLTCLSKHNQDTFLKGYFMRREEFRKTLEDMPVYIVTNDYVAALGSLSGAMDSFNSAEVTSIWGNAKFATAAAPEGEEDA